MAAAADDAADAKALQNALRTLQHPSHCDARPVLTFKDWRNGLGAQLSTLVGVWSAMLNRESAAGTPVFGARAPLLVPLGGLRCGLSLHPPGRFPRRLLRLCLRLGLPAAAVA